MNNSTDFQVFTSMDTNVPSANCEEGIDRISNMPNAILGKILSYVPTKDAVATSILSSRWKNLFPFEVPHPITLCFDHSKPETLPSRSFVNFMDKLLYETLRDHGPTSLDKLVLQCGERYYDDKIVSWVNAALRLNVVHLRLMSKLNDSKTLFHGLIGCTTLVKLELGGNFQFCLPREFVLPNLKRLSLYKLLMCNDSNKWINELSYGCPKLDDLSFIHCGLRVSNNLIIKTLLLKRLSIEGCLFAGRNILIDAPNLEVFEYKGNLGEYRIVTDFKYLHSVSFEFDSFGAVYDENRVTQFAGSLARLLKACSNTIRLYLDGNSITGLHRASFILPLIFQNLTSLALGYMGRHGFEILAHLLESSPSLHTLTFEKGFKNCRSGYAGFKSLLPTPPICMKLCLKKIEFLDFRGAKDEIKLIEYFLKNGIILQAVTIHYLSRVISTSIFSGLLMFPKHSKTCQILLREKDNRSSTYFSRSRRNSPLKSIGLSCFEQFHYFTLKHKPTISCFCDLTS